MGFLAEIAVGGGMGEDPTTFFRLGAVTAAAVRDGDFWRIGSYAFLHAGPVHILVNGYALWVLMRPIEALFGPVVALGIFAATAMAGGGASIASSSLRHVPWQASVGASGGIFGLFGAHCALYWRLRHQLTPEARSNAGRTLLFNLLINVALAVMLQASNFPLDNGAHAGGFLFGIVLGLVAPSPALRRRPWGRPAFAFLILSCFVLASLEGVAVARAVRPHARMLRGPGVEARVPWNLVPFAESVASTPEALFVELRRPSPDDPPDPPGEPSRLGGKAWRRNENLKLPDGEPVLRLSTDDIVVQAFCRSDSCTPQARDALAEEVAAAAHTTGRCKVKAKSSPPRAGAAASAC
jgi:rhomboid protease GluP